MSAIKIIIKSIKTYVDNCLTSHLNCDWNKFEDYKKHEPLLYFIVPDLVDFKNGKCSRISAKNIPIDEKRKPGRPAKAKKTLIIHRSSLSD
ncbi:hypothetical protein BpHYR1_010180 [Brachionus plicatilis]|uniref:Uncharacterized protein n=1 Tax=Brachionus plicatilis TaxID=10195 RepID=A0A3M7QDZ7_BRAPC|nr:hypothetical protein BpHYR1_010180 [Brachionus plicatilis]